MIKYTHLLLVFLPLIGFSQGSFIKTYGGPGNDDGWYVIEDSSGNFVLCGDSMGTTSQDYLFKVDASGNTIWSKTYGNDARELARCVKQTIDGDYLLFGDRDNFNTGGDQVALIIRTSSNGDSLWSYEMLGTNMSRYGVSIITLPDSGFILGSVDDGPLFQNPYQLSKLDKNGANVWWPYKDIIASTYFGGYGSSLISTMNGGFAVAGINEINVQTQDAMSLAKTDTAGNIEWYKEFIGNQNCDGISVWQCADSGFVIAGYTDCYGVGGRDMYILRTDQNGDSLWEKTFGGSGDEIAIAIQQTSDLGFVVFGQSCPTVGNNNDIVLLRLDMNGDSLWENTFGGNGNDQLRHGIITRDGGYAMVGSTASFGAGGTDVLLIKTDSLGLLTTNKESIQQIGFTFLSYPNPFSGSLKLSFESTSVRKLEIRNSIGKCVYQQISTPFSSTFDINTDAFPKGVYVVRIWDLNGNTAEKIVVKL